MNATLVRLAALAFVVLPSFCAAQKSHEIELIHADKFTVDKSTPKGANKLKGNVQLKHQNALMFCDSALLFDDNTVKAYGHVRIVENDSFTLKGDSLFYDGESKLAKVRGNVLIDNGSSTLKTKILDYDREAMVGRYFSGGEIVSRTENIHLVSTRGQYFSERKVFHFKKDVVMKHPDYTIHTDTMHYSTDLEKTWFYGPTQIDFKDRNIYCEYGWFDQIKDKAQFIDHAEIRSSGQIIRADTITYDQKNQIGISTCFVELIDTAEKIAVEGNYAVFNEVDSSTLITDQVLMKQDMDGDTFFLTADTLYSLMDSSRNRIMKTYYHSRFFKKDMQGRCDSLVYMTKDSIIYLFGDPVIWSEENQITADSIHITMRNSTVDKMYMDQDAFIIAREDSMFYNQIKGRNMVGIFTQSELTRVDVFGNGQTIYYPRESDNTMIGVNETKCSNMTIRIDSSRIRNISFYDKPTAKLTPTDDMPAAGLALDGFQWRGKERPGSVLDLRYGTSSTPVKPVVAPKLPLVVDSLQIHDTNAIRSKDDVEMLTPGEPPKAPAEPAQPSNSGEGNRAGMKSRKGAVQEPPKAPN